MPDRHQALASRVVGLELNLSGLDFGGSCNLVLRRHGAGGRRPAQGRRHDWVEAEDLWGSGELPLSGILEFRFPGLWECTCRPLGGT